MPDTKSLGLEKISTEPPVTVLQGIVWILAHTILKDTLSMSLKSEATIEIRYHQITIEIIAKQQFLLKTGLNA